MIGWLVHESFVSSYTELPNTYLVWTGHQHGSKDLGSTDAHRVLPVKYDHALLPGRRTASRAGGGGGGGRRTAVPLVGQQVIGEDPLQCLEDAPGGEGINHLGHTLGDPCTTWGRKGLLAKAIGTGSR